MPFFNSSSTMIRRSSIHLSSVSLLLFTLKSEERGNVSKWSKDWYRYRHYCLGCGWQQREEIQPPLHLPSSPWATEGPSSSGLTSYFVDTVKVGGLTVYLVSPLEHGSKWASTSPTQGEILGKSRHTHLSIEEQWIRVKKEDLIIKNSR